MTTQAVGEVGAIKPDWTWGDKVRKVRRIVGLSQKEFADRIDVKAPTVAAWETSDAVEPPKGAIAAAKRMHLAFNIDTAWLLGLEDERPTPGPGPGGGLAKSGSTRGYRQNVKDLRPRKSGSSVPTSPIPGVAAA
jgi:transcriptional regulator with XRE-family HTH domain